ncbi:MAG: sigma 54-interacting transcriptional regulator [Gemmataceae bacterium]|nr:sigma 54-interacting transcriptional regulator [Gemmataceae bacterium]
MADPDPKSPREEVDTLRAIVEGTARHTGDEFFRALVRNLSRATGVPNAFVAEFAGSDTRVRTLAYWRAGALAPNAEWDLPGTPCEDVLRGGVCHHPTGVAEKFPNDPGVESYFGVPLREAGGAVLGHLAVYNDRPMPAEPRLLDTFHIFAARAAAELDRLRMDRMLRDSEARYRDLFEEAPVAYLAVDADGCLRRVNRAVIELLGRPAEALDGTCLIDYASPTPAGRPRMEAVLAEYLAGRPVVGQEVEFARPDGSPVWLALWVRPFPGPDGRPVGGRVVGTDITARVLAERDGARLRQQNQYLREELKAAHNYDEIVGRSPALVAVLQRVSKVAGTDSTVLVTGETGTGKELIARAVHSAGPRAGKPLVKLNCAALPAGLVESELFGHEKGAFTGADRKRIGRFELADGGTLFLDEVGELPLDTQAKLLRVLQEKEFERVGGTDPVRIDVRVIAATNRDLGAMVKAKQFREDLFYRLNVFPVPLPPLRDRPDDISLLVHFVVAKLAARMGKRVDAVGPDTLALLTAYPWPGNVRELENVLERAVILADGPVLEIDPEVLPVGPESPEPNGLEPTSRTLQAVEREHILAALTQSGWVIEGPGGAARLLGLHPNTLRSRLKRFGIARPSPDQP